MPSNSLAAIYGLAMDCAERQVLGRDTHLLVDAYDETNTRIRPERIARDIASAGVGLVGVQSNQYPRAMDLARRFRALGIEVVIGGFHVSDTPARVMRDIKIIQSELPIDFLEFFILTPLPGSEDHQKLAHDGVAMDVDLNRYDTFHVVTAHPTMSRSEWEETYWAAWRTYYTYGHMCTLMRRAAACRISLGKMLSMLISFWSLSLIEHTHPLEGGYLRRKVRTDRRHGLPIIPVWRFWPMFTVDLVKKLARVALMTVRLLTLRYRLKHDGTAHRYRDLALTPISDPRRLELLTVTESARNAARARLRPLMTTR
jgi:hypothetical protein